MRKTLLLLAVILLFTAPSFAQDAPFEVFGGYSFMRAGGGGTFNGWAAAFAGNLNEMLSIKGEISGYYKGGVKNHTFMGGPQVGKQLDGVPARMFGHALFGLSNSRAGGFGGSNAFSMALGGGLDWNVGNFIVRAPQFDYAPTIKSGTSNNIRIQAGVVFPLGK